MPMRLLSKHKGMEFDLEYAVKFDADVATPKDSVAKMYEIKNEMIVILEVPKSEYQSEGVQEVIKWGGLPVTNKNYYRDIAIDITMMEDYKRSIVFTHAYIRINEISDTTADFITIVVYINQKRDKFVGVEFGEELNETYKIAFERVNNPPKMNVVAPVVMSTVLPGIYANEVDSVMDGEVTDANGAIKDDNKMYATSSTTTYYGVFYTNQYYNFTLKTYDSSFNQFLSSPNTCDYPTGMNTLFKWGYRASSGLIFDTETSAHKNFKRSTYVGPLSYYDDSGKSYSFDWMITDLFFRDCYTLTQKQITAILNKYNSQLVSLGFDVAIYESCHMYGINPKIILATLELESGWCAGTNYTSCFGVGPAGQPSTFSQGNYGGLYYCIDAYLKAFAKGLTLTMPRIEIANIDVNLQDVGYLGSSYDYVNILHPNDSKIRDYFVKGQSINILNAAMYARIFGYNTWLYYPPDHAESTKIWHNEVMNTFENGKY